MVISCTYDEVEEFKNGLCRVKRTGVVKAGDNPWGIINKKGVLVKPWTNAVTFSDKLDKVDDTMGKIALVGNALRKILGM